MREWVVVVYGSLGAVYGPYFKEEAEAKAREFAGRGQQNVAVRGLLR